MKRRVVFVGLETFSLKGGIQRFNQRLFAAARVLLDSGEIEVFRAYIKEPTGIGAGADIVSCRNRLQLLRRVLAGGTADVLIIGHINLLPVAALFRLLHPRTRIMLIVHGDEVWGTEGMRKRRFAERAQLGLVTKIVSVSHYTADVMAQAYGLARDRFAILYNAVDVDQNAPPANGHRAGSVLTVTRLSAGEKRKNIEPLIRAFGEVLQLMPTATLTIVGRGVLADSYRRLADELAIGHAVTIREDVDDAELAKLYDRASLFALPSDKEGFGIVYLEAWLHGVPVICSVNGAPAEIVEDGIDGIVVDPARTDALRDAMLVLLGDPHRAAAMGQNGLQKVRACYSNQRFVERFGATIGAMFSQASAH